MSLEGTDLSKNSSRQFGRSIETALKTKPHTIFSDERNFVFINLWVIGPFPEGGTLQRKQAPEIFCRNCLSSSSFMTINPPNECDTIIGSGVSIPPALSAVAAFSDNKTFFISETCCSMVTISPGSWGGIPVVEVPLKLMAYEWWPREEKKSR